MHYYIKVKSNILIKHDCNNVKPIICCVLTSLLISKTKQKGMSITVQNKVFQGSFQIKIINDRLLLH